MRTFQVIIPDKEEHIIVHGDYFMYFDDKAITIYKGSKPILSTPITSTILDITKVDEPT